MTYIALYGVGGCETKSGINFPSTDEMLIDQATSKIYLLSSISKSYIVHAEISYKGELNMEELKQYNARIALQKIQMQQARAQVNEEVISAREQILAAKEQTEVALEGSQLGEQALKQSIERQQLGTVRPFEILQAMEIYIKSRLDHLKAVSTYNKAQYRLFVSVGNKL